MNNPSPLRYPGGKHRFYPYVREILDLNSLLGETYIEPFAGGAGLALRLLLANDVKRIIINDFDPHVYAFWHAILNNTKHFCDLVLKTPVTVEQWNIQKDIYSSCNTGDLLRLGFATFFLNRTNVSGVLTGGIIGGKKQLGQYKIDARFPKDILVQKIKVIASRKKDITLSCIDAFALFKQPFIQHIHNSFINFDPPYVGKGAQLYKNSFSETDHLRFAKQVKRNRRKWIVTYDVDPLVLKAYSPCRIGYMDVSYSVGEQKDAKEYIIFSNNLIIPSTTTIVN